MPPKAATPEVEEETFEAVVPEDLKIDESMLSVGEEEGEAKPEEKAKPKAEAKPKPEPEPEPKLDRAVHEERRKRKRYAEMYQEAIRERDRAIQAAQAREPADETPEAEKKWREDLKRRADEAKSLGEAIEPVFQEIDRLKTRLTTQARWESMMMRAAISEVKAMGKHPDFEEAMEKAGVFDALSLNENGQFKDPALARYVFLSKNPGETAYGYAKGKLAEETGDQDGEAERLPAETPKPKAEEKPKPEAEAERRGARRVIEEVEKAAERPKGIRGIRQAGEPAGRYSRAQLDTLMETNPAHYKALVKANPALERWHLGGI